MLSQKEKRRLLSYLQEDIGQGDITSAITPKTQCSASISANEKCTLAGIEQVQFLCSHYNVRVKKLKKDGSKILNGTRILVLNGQNRKILTLERVCLNILGRMSGVATLCSQATKKSPATTIAVTRKTSPGFQLFDKKAAQKAGAWTHRKDLSEMILIKENHLKFFSSIEQAFAAAKRSGKKIEIEVETRWQALAAAEQNPHMILLDNFPPEVARKTIQDLRKRFKGKIELSGGITLKNLKKYSNLGADVISMGELTKSAKIIDFSLDIERVQK
ncbi:MAG TPA: carboxylating nicotinate-nucleotide diphosphorylase [archaeon]|nr:carboxylating nicotinate-nucleotide diphosphorylase [archaeon]